VVPWFYLRTPTPHNKRKDALLAVISAILRRDA